MLLVLLVNTLAVDGNGDGDLVDSDGVDVTD
jgi:hypothetical protein